VEGVGGQAIQKNGWQVRQPARKMADKKQGG